MPPWPPRRHGFTPSLAGRVVSAAQPVRLQPTWAFAMPETTARVRPKSLYDFSRNRCTASSETTVRFRPSRTSTTASRAGGVSVEGDPLDPLDAATVRHRPPAAAEHVSSAIAIPSTPADLLGGVQNGDRCGSQTVASIEHQEPREPSHRGLSGLLPGEGISDEGGNLGHEPRVRRQLVKQPYGDGDRDFAPTILRHLYPKGMNHSGTRVE